MDLLRREHWVRILAEEGYVAQLYADATSDGATYEDVFIAEIEYGLEDG